MTFASVVLPCLNERDTVESCIREAFAGLRAAGVEGEVVVADNGSIDGSLAVIEHYRLKLGQSDELLRVVHCTERGYGAALRAGFAAAAGNVLVMADADGTYALADVPHFLGALADGADMVVGNRFAGGIEEGAMPWSHRYLGVPGLTWLLNQLFGTRIGDAHCGLRAVSRDAYNRIDPKSNGMEFASELIVRAAQLGMRIDEVPTMLRRGPEGRVPHLRSLRDGWRHVRYLLWARIRRVPPAPTPMPVRRSEQSDQTLWSRGAAGQSKPSGGREAVR